MSGLLKAMTLTLLLLASIDLIACSKLKAPGAAAAAETQTTSESSSVATRSIASSTTSVTSKTSFLGAFFRPQGTPPFGIFSAEQTAPNPYPTPGTVMLGSNGYCEQRDAAGNSIDGSFPVDTKKLNDLIFLGARWSRMPASQFFIDNSHIFGPGQYAFATLDAAQCISLVYHHIRPIINLEAGPVNYNAVPGTFSPATFAMYQTAADFGTWCGIVAAHEKAIFPSVTQFTLPGNEVNSNTGLFPGGAPQVAAYSKACYAAIKAANSNAFVYGFELNMDGGLNTPAFVRQEVALGCKVGTCYDGLAIHMTLRYPIPPAGTPCYPNVGGDYGMQCVTDIESAAQAPIHVLISESVYTIPGLVPDEQTKGQAIVDEMTAFTADPTIDGVLYSNIDECPLYPSGFFMNGCLVDQSGNYLTSYIMLQWFAANHLI